MVPDRPPPPHSRVRWGNVARAGALVGLAVLAALWPRLGPGEPRLPPVEPAPVVSLRPPAPQAPVASAPGSGDPRAEPRPPAGIRGYRTKTAHAHARRAVRKSVRRRSVRIGGDARARRAVRKSVRRRSARIGGDARARRAPARRAASRPRARGVRPSPPTSGVPPAPPPAEFDFEAG